MIFSYLIFGHTSFINTIMFGALYMIILNQIFFNIFVKSDIEIVNSAHREHSKVEARLMILIMDVIVPLFPIYFCSFLIKIFTKFKIFIEAKFLFLNSANSFKGQMKYRVINYGSIVWMTRQEVLEMLNTSPFEIKCVIDQTEELCLFAVRRNGYVLQYVKEQNESICLEAVKQDGYALQYVKEQTESICLEAVKQNGEALAFVKNQTPHICLEAVKQDAFVLVLVENQTENICWTAVKQNPQSLKFVKNQTPEICLEAIKQDMTVWPDIRIVPTLDFETTLQNLKKKQLILNSI